MISVFDLPERIQSHILIAENGCWNWTAALSHNGYGRVWTGVRNRAAHRYIYELLVALVDGRLQLDHLCQNRKCVNPEHLEPVTSKENLRRSGHANRLKTHCKHGHEFTEENTLIDKFSKTPHRRCKICIATVYYKPLDLAPKTHCLRGHPLSGDNVYIQNGNRSCKTCRRVAKKIHYFRVRHGYEIPEETLAKLYKES